jgi:hypothetical protein
MPIEFISAAVGNLLRAPWYLATSARRTCDLRPTAGSNTSSSGALVGVGALLLAGLSTVLGKDNKTKDKTKAQIRVCHA